MVNDGTRRACTARHSRRTTADVPVCTTCHGVHNIHEAETPAFRLGSVDLCVKCHSDKDLMDKYEISSSVTKTYLEDFHGKTIGFYQGHDQTVWPDVAVCTDCHGVHDIKSADDPNSSVVKENLVATCRKCHPDATTSFPSAWLSHYEPSFEKHPLVFLVQQYYKVLIPIMVVGLALNVGLDLPLRLSASPLVNFAAFPFFPVSYPTVLLSLR